MEKGAAGGGGKKGKGKKDKSRQVRKSMVNVDTKPKKTEISPFAIRILNTITYNQTKLTITKKFTVKDIHEAYGPFESHPEFYLWTDMYGRILDLDKTVVENELMGAEETVEFDGIGKEPVIILIFKDGFENERPSTLNPTQLHDPKDWEQGLCRNY